MVAAAALPGGGDRQKNAYNLKQEDVKMPTLTSVDCLKKKKEKNSPQEA